MAFIVSTLLAGANDQRVQMGAEEIVRKHGLGRWTRIRIAVHYGYLGQTVTSGCNFVCGLCQGPTGWSQPNCVDAIGMWFGINANPYAVTTSQGTNAWIFGAGCTGFRKVGPTITSAVGNAGGIQVCVPNYPVLTRSAFFYEITKLFNGTITIGGYFAPSAAVASTIDIDRFTLLDQIQRPDGPTLSGNFSVLAPATVNVGTSAQTWDSIFFSWNKSVPLVEISEILAIQMW